MKFNIKNFPRTVDGENRDEADIWVEGFEKELREILENERKLWKHDETVAIKYLKEILGESKE